MTDVNTLDALIGTPVDPLPDKWRDSARAQAAAAAMALDRDSPDRYWEWAAGQLRWLAPWQSVRSGDFPDAKFFAGGLINVADNCVDRHAENPALADVPAIIWEGEPANDTRTLTFRELRDEVCRCANALKALGIGKGDVVALYMQNLPEAYVTVHACNRIGAIYTILFSGFSADAIATRLETAQPKVIVIADRSYRRRKPVDLLQTWRNARAESPAVTATLVFNRSGEAPALEAGEFDYRELLDNQSAHCPCEPLEANDPAFLVFTSGTTSKPKGIVHSVAGFLVGAWSNAYWQLGAAAGQVCWCATDVGWLTFPIQSLVGGLAAGATQVCYEGALDYPDNSRFYQIAARYAVEKILTAPTAVRMLRGFGDDIAAAHPLPHLQVLSVQGEPLDATSYHWVRKQLVVPVINAYGQTETGSTWTYPICAVDDTKAGSCGKPVPGYRGAIVDDTGQPVAPGVRGNLVLTHPIPSMARTIWNDHARFLSTYFTRFPGKYWCADEAVMDRDGHLWVLGRADDVINVAGHRLSTMEMESAMSAHPGVTEGAVIGVHDDLKGLVPVAFVVLKREANATETAQDLKRRVEKAIGGIGRLDAVFATAMLPKTRTGKIVRRLLVEIVEKGAVSSDTSSLEDQGAIAACLSAERY